MDFPGLFRIIIRVILSFVLMLAVYLGAAVVLSYIPVNSDFVECDKDCIEIYLKTNGIHTDLVLPLQNDSKDWNTTVHPADTRSGMSKATLVAFGWGDRGFYLNTPEWADLTFQTAFEALFYLGSSIMHVTFYEGLRESETCKKIRISKGSYQRIVHHIEQNFNMDETGKALLITGAGYTNNDAFYEATGTYGFLFTCNTWTNNVLKQGGLKACVWTPFDKGIFHHYKTTEAK